MQHFPLLKVSPYKVLTFYFYIQKYKENITDEHAVRKLNNTNSLKFGKAYQRKRLQ